MQDFHIPNAADENIILKKREVVLQTFYSPEWIELHVAAVRTAARV